MRIGAHLSISKGLPHAIEMCLEIEANTLQFFTRNPRGGKTRKIPEVEIEKWLALRREHQIAPVFAHLPYTVNLASPTDKSYTFAKRILAEDLERMKRIGAEYLIVHPGSYVKSDQISGIKRIIQALEEVLLPACCNITLCLETMSGKGTEIGSHLEELKVIMQAVGYPKNLGICLDSCHLFAAGYDFRLKQEVERCVETLDQTVGLARIKVSHLNDSKEKAASRKDRHALLGQGLLGDDGIFNYMSHPSLKDLPFILETPVKDYSQYKEEILHARNLTHAG